LIGISFSAYSGAVLVSKGHLNDVTPIIVLIFFLADWRVAARISSILSPVSFDSIGSQLKELARSLYRLPILDINFCGFDFDSPH